MLDVALVTGLVQSRKTFKCFEIISKQLRPNTLILFVTQANSTTSANQLIGRAKRFPGLLSEIPYMSRCVETIELYDQMMLVDFYNIKNINKMVQVARDKPWEYIILIIDEIESGAVAGVEGRLNLLNTLSALQPSSLYAILVTATVANLSHCIRKISEKNADLCKIFEEPIDHYHVVPDGNYVGASWFKNNLQELKLPKLSDYNTKDEYNYAYKKHIFNTIKAIPVSHKDVTLVVTTNRVVEHDSMANRLLKLGYNVVVILNGSNTKDYTVLYDNEVEVKEWNIPYKLFNKYANSSLLKKYTSAETGKSYDTSIESEHDLSLSHMLQVMLRMGTDVHQQIVEHVHLDERYKLLAMFNKMRTENLRPADYPNNVRLAIVAGNIASRGITIQNQMINFACTSFVLVETKDQGQLGAVNTQRFGRACGILKEIFVNKKQPIMIATAGIINAALANETVLCAKASQEKIILKDFITKEEYKQVVKEISTKLVQSVALETPQKAILKLFHDRNIISVKDAREAGIPIDINHRRDFTVLAKAGYIKKTGNQSYWEILESGKSYLKTLT